MRTEDEVREKLRQAIQQAKERTFREKLARSPQNCSHYERGVCWLKSKTSPLGERYIIPCTTVEQAGRCKVYCGKYTPGALEMLVRRELETKEIRFRKHRDAAILMWVLDETETPETPPTWRDTWAAHWAQIKNALINMTNHFSF